jgi:AcrR family transcriptional regulator
MRALPGRSSRSQIADPATITRDQAEHAQRERILRATAELIAKRGYGEVTIELIVKRSQVSFKTFYKRFPNKEAAFCALFDSFMAEAQERINEALIGEQEAPWPQQVIAALRALFELILDDPLVARACIVEGLTVSREIISRYERSMTALSPLIRRGREFNPQVADLPKTLEDALAGGVLWIPYQRLIVGEVDQIEALLPEAVEFVLRPYLGDTEASRWAKWSQEKTNEPVSMTR